MPAKEAVYGGRISITPANEKPPVPGNERLRGVPRVGEGNAASAWRDRLRDQAIIDFNAGAWLSIHASKRCGSRPVSVLKSLVMRESPPWPIIVSIEA